jgi:hypothetical protein
VWRFGYPDLPDVLEGRRQRAVAVGLDPADRALLDADTAVLLAQTALGLIPDNGPSHE